MNCVPLCGAGDNAPWWQHATLCPARRCSHCGASQRPGEKDCPLCGPHVHGRPEWYSGNTSGRRYGIGGQMISHPEYTCERCGAELIEQPDVWPYCPVCDWCPDCGITHEPHEDARTQGRLLHKAIPSDHPNSDQ